MPGRTGLPVTEPVRVLILGGTTEATQLCDALEADQAVAPILSLAGRTERPVVPNIPFRVGGFGGDPGLSDYLRRERIGAVVDATHPFAAQIKRNAAAACAATDVPLLAFSRAAWVSGPGDRWTLVDTISGAISALGDRPRRVFLTTGRIDIAQFRTAAQHFYLVRTIDLPAPELLPPHCRSIQARGPFSAETEEALVRAERIEVLVTKNSGGAATAGKLTAARNLGLPVIMVERPATPQRLETHDLARVLAWIADQRPPAP